MSAENAKNRHGQRQLRWAVYNLKLAEERRQPFASLYKLIVCSTLERYLSAVPSALLEIGCGIGQLRQWLPASIKPHVLHSDPSSELIKESASKQTGSAVLTAHADRLPVAAGSLSAVLGLCVWDILKDQAAARNEIARVLAPEGRFFHFLDMGTDLEMTFADLAEQGLVPLPNFLNGELTGHRPEDALQARLPAVDPLDDLVLVPRDQLNSLTRSITVDKTAEIDPFVAYLEMCARSFEAHHASQAFMSIRSDRELLAGVSQMLQSWYVDRASTAFEVLPYSSIRHLQRKMEVQFGHQSEFEIDFSGIITAREIRKRDNSLPSDCQYLGRWMGQTVVKSEMPILNLGVCINKEAELVSVAGLGEGNVLVESAMLVLVARTNRRRRL